MDREASLRKIAMLCGKDSYDKIDEFTFNYTENIIKNFCNIDEIPVGLEETFIDMAAEIEKSGCFGENQNMGDIKSISEGDISMTFSDAKNDILSLKDFREQLENFRRPKW